VSSLGARARRHDRTTDLLLGRVRVLGLEALFLSFSQFLLHVALAFSRFKHVQPALLKLTLLLCCVIQHVLPADQQPLFHKPYDKQAYRGEGGE
jgi:mannitol-specific phosphotransferase system IIBC component